MPLRSCRLAELRWPEVSALDRDHTIIIQPVGAIEQHGHHLPLDADTAGAEQLALRAAEAVNAGGKGVAVVAPAIPWGTSPHHLAYPGTLSLSMKTMSDVMVDIIGSLTRHRFYRFLFLNGHGGNAGVLAATALRISEELGISPAVVTYWNLIRDTLGTVMTSERGGLGHACEMETSMQLHLRCDAVDMAEARKSLPRDLTTFTTLDFRTPGPVMLPWDFSRDSKTGVMGDPSVATAEKGKAVVDAAVGRLAALAGELLLLGEADFRKA